MAAFAIIKGLLQTRLGGMGQPQREPALAVEARNYGLYLLRVRSGKSRQNVR